MADIKIGDRVRIANTQHPTPDDPEFTVEEFGTVWGRPSAAGKSLHSEMKIVWYLEELEKIDV